MIEVETKVKVFDLEKCKNKIVEISKYKGRQIKIDDYYTLENLKNYPKKSLRIRNHDGKWEINFKKRIDYKNGIYAKKETEFNVKNSEDFLKLIEDFGFKKWLRKEKITYLYEIKNNFHIELNEVKGLGWFMEIEYLTDEKGINKARNEISNLMNKLGIERKLIVKEGYTKLLWDKKKR